MAFYKLNKLHFHLTDDEGWRLEIPGLPELTDVGAKRGVSVDGEPMLPPAYGSGGLADEQISAGTGYYTKSQFIDLLRFATQHHIEVIPEINGPGHARAAIIAMKARYEKLMGQGKESDARAYLLSDLNDASKYSSAQNYHDNVICVCQEYTYTFLEKVISEVVAMYREAEAPLNIVHTGGDEVPHGAWTGSPECSRLIKDEQNLNSVDDLHPYFVQRYLDIAKKYDLEIAGWEEITLKHTEEGNVPNPEFLNKGVIPYAWNAIVGGGGEDMAYQLANLGYKVVMCNASNLYFDLAYTYEPEEPGLFWAGYIDTKNAFELTPSNIFLSILEDELGNPLDGITLSKDRIPLRPGAEENILGIQGALWSETLKNTQMVEYSLLPKMLGLAERAWAASPPWANATSRQELKRSIDREWSNFTNRIGKLELPRLDYLNGGYFYRISPPGAKIENGKLYINSEYPGLQLRYTTDGSDPNPFSTEYEAPVELPANVDIIKIRAFSTNSRASRLVEVQPEAKSMN
jgi:hexosaminidase